MVCLTPTHHKISCMQDYDKVPPLSQPAFTLCPTALSHILHLEAQHKITEKYHSVTSLSGKSAENDQEILTIIMRAFAISNEKEEKRLSIL